MTHPAVYVVTIGFAVGAALLTFFLSNRRNYETSYRKGDYDCTFVASEFTCTICHEKILDMDIKYLPCGHSFHETCISRWLHRQASCPNCRCPATTS